MTCPTCKRHREWALKWTKVAYERAASLFRTNPEAEPEEGRPSGDQRSVPDQSRGAGATDSALGGNGGSTEL
ncbi:hypothetical protein D8767_08040 [Pseudomonas sp. LTGT-11-2Z]|nr:hypothetical protein D8767_08040 [Pseudomonas sp. LTGT-11-2Z]